MLDAINHFLSHLLEFPIVLAEKELSKLCIQVLFQIVISGLRAVTIEPVSVFNVCLCRRFLFDLILKHEFFKYTIGRGLARFWHLDVCQEVPEFRCLKLVVLKVANLLVICIGAHLHEGVVVWGSFTEYAHTVRLVDTFSAQAGEDKQRTVDVGQFVDLSIDLAHEAQISLAKTTLLCRLWQG